MRVYYNSRCPVCDAGVRSQRRRMEAAGAGPIDWRDINREPDALAACGASLDDVRRKLYVIDDAGAVHIGADGFTALWRATPGQRWFGRLLASPGFKTLGHALYDWFADRLYAWNRRKGRW
jgi:predicted DCC family thiol-disulfide oxidoreductase YuxK